jgi:hypothetical protein
MIPKYRPILKNFKYTISQICKNIKVEKSAKSKKISIILTVYHVSLQIPN